MKYFILRLPFLKRSVFSNMLSWNKLLAHDHTAFNGLCIIWKHICFEHSISKGMLFQRSQGPEKPMAYNL